MPINASHEYFEAEKKYLNAQNLEDKIFFLEEMIRTAPKHKGSENLLAELRTRLKKFREKNEKARKKSGKQGIRKEGFQFVLVGVTNSGKSSLLGKITNANPKVGEFPFTTKNPELGTFLYEGVSAQVVDIPSVGSEDFDIGIVHTADCLLVVFSDFEELEILKEVLSRNKGKRIFVFNKADLLDDNELRKINARLRSKRLNGVVVSCSSRIGLDNLKEKMFNEMGVVRIFTKEPGRPKTNKPIVLKEGSKVRDVAEGILKGFSKRVKEVMLNGPSGKFPNQKVGLSHVLKDLDVVEFHTK